jgi:hypothetical protein
VEQLVDMVRAYARQTSRRKLVLGFTAPGLLWKAMRSGDLIPAADAAVGRQTFDEWLAAKV